MPKEEWGVKRICPTTGKRFYDLNKSPIVSPYSGEVVEIDLTGRKGPAANATPASVVADKRKAATEDADEDLLVEGGDDVDIEDDLLDDEDDDSVALDDLADVADDDEDT
ncbi:TIGR02300 family protein [Alkalilacustris brevis]|uniref:TIGR02300 family protein n=1 Tax=Alkalilacustris brevis TaxID=2026338 RepID=UPI000E0D7BDA|nr:TIGR02300 family protein [Alkalilacustris brevis]